MDNVASPSWTRDQLRADILDILREKARALDGGLAGPLTDETRVLGDLGFESVTIVEFCVAVGRRFRRKLPFQELVFRDGKFQDFTVGELVSFVEKHVPV